MTRTNLESVSNMEDEFESMLDDYQYIAPKRGQILEGVVESILEDSIILDVGLKRAASVPPREIKNMDDEVLDGLSVGDLIPVYVTGTPVGSESLLVSIEKAMEYRDWIEVGKLLDQDEAVELVVSGENRGGLLVEFNQLEGFVPNSLVPELKKLHDRKQMQEKKQSMIGSNMLVKPVEVDRNRQKLVFSASAAQDEQRESRLLELENGQVFEGTVTNVVDFGVFVDLGGVDGLVHISELDWSRVEHPSELFAAGDEIRVLVKDIDVERERISLSRKDLIPSPWETAAEKLKAGDIVDARVVNIVDFGVFAELMEGVEGLIHDSELGDAQTESVKDALEPGDVVRVKILSIQAEQGRISLSMRQVP